MSMINYASREINCKIVYYGPGLGGKTTNLEHVYGKVKPDTRGKLISLATETERTLFFDFLPVDLGTITRRQHTDKREESGGKRLEGKRLAKTLHRTKSSLGAYSRPLLNNDGMSLPDSYIITSTHRNATCANERPWRFIHGRGYRNE